MKLSIISLLLVTAIFITHHSLQAQDHILPLWGKDQIPNYQKSDDVEQADTNKIIQIRFVQEPNIAVFLPTNKNATGQAVIICPGGGYSALSYDWEGTAVAKYLNSIGVAGIVLKYRLPISKSNVTRYKSPLLDAQRALRMTRNYAKQWNIDPAKVGIMGFSAGGHLASTAGTHFDNGNQNATDPVEKLSCRPDFLILMYPVITFTQPSMHKGSRDNLLGENPDQNLINEFSNELKVTKETPPAFLVHAGDDKGVPVENSILFYNALIKNGVPAEMHIYPKGGHGFSLAIGKGHLSTWTERLSDWLQLLDK